MATAPHGGPSARLRRQQEVEMYGVPDMVLLSNPITDHSILKNLRTRFERSLIYTGIGSVLLAVNPFRNIKGLYGEEQVRFYHESSHLGRGEAAGGASAAMQQIAGSEARLGGPHIFAVAEEAYRNMLSEEQNQCIIISGESGAGKTEASKQITSFLSSVSGHTAEMQRVKNIILQSNPLIEAFGNAKTVRNDNSSRFGKFFQVYFDRFGGPVGGHMDGFLLEKSRVSSVQDGERNFHVFYQMCAGADEALRDSLQLKSADHYCYLNPARRAAAEKGLGSAGTAQYIPGSLLRSGVDDAADWASTLAAMEAIGMAPSDRTAVLDTLALVLHVGEVQFHESAAAAGGVVGSDPCRIANDAVLQRVAERLGVDGEKLRRALTWRSLRTGQSEVVQVPLDLQQCQNTRDALAKALYASLFDFILAAVNRALTEREPHALMLGVLDIYGFEVFSERNGYEQFCINYVNERLQELFIELTLKVEQEEYVQEGIPWEEVHYFDNREVCRLLDGTNPPGLFQIMDDVCLALSKEEETVVDRKLAERMDLAHHESSFFHRVDRGFSIHHYAGEVCYDTSGFTSRNKDLLSADMLELLTLSTKPFLLELVGPLLVTVGRGSSAAASQRSMTAGQKLRLQAATLIDTLKQCQPHYVRTIKPNDVKRPDLMDDARMLHQIKYLGLQENIRVRRAGYSYRQYLDKFIQRFRFLSPATFPRLLTGSDRQACEAILHAAEVRGVIPPGSWALGRHKVFVRQPDHLFSLEDARADALDRLVERIQRSWRGYRDRRTFICLKDAVDGLFTQHRKARRADSVFRPFDGRHIDLAAISSHPAVPFLHRYMDYDPVGEAWKTSWCSDTGKAYYWNAITLDTTWELPYELEHRSQRVVFCAEVERVGVRSHKDQTELDVHLQVLLITDRALLLVEKCASTPPPATAEKKKPRRENRQPLEQPRWWLRKRIDLRLLAGISVTKQADDVVGLHFYIPNKAARPIHSSSQPPDVAASKKSSGTPTITCEVCGERVRHTSTHCSICPCCGRRCCTHTCLTVRRPLPTLVGHVEPVLVCVRCRYSEPLEPVEDLLLRSPAKTELLALLSCASHARSGRPTAITVADSFSISTASSSSVAAAAAAPRKSRRSKAEEPTHASTSELLWRQWHVQAELDPSLEEHVELRWSDESEAVLVRSPGGLPQATIAAIHAARAVRRQHEAARHHAEAAARKEAEGQREADRERQRQEQVAERRKQRALKAAEAEALNRSREEAAAQRREEAARLVSQRAARIHQ